MSVQNGESLESGISLARPISPSLSLSTGPTHSAGHGGGLVDSSNTKHRQTSQQPHLPQQLEQKRNNTTSTSISTFHQHQVPSAQNCGTTPQNGNQNSNLSPNSTDVAPEPHHASHQLDHSQEAATTQIETNSFSLSLSLEDSDMADIANVTGHRGSTSDATHATEDADSKSNKDNSDDMDEDPHVGPENGPRDHNMSLPQNAGGSRVSQPSASSGSSPSHVVAWDATRLPFFKIIIKDREVARDINADIQTAELYLKDCNLPAPAASIRQDPHGNVNVRLKGDRESLADLVRQLCDQWNPDWFGGNSRAVIPHYLVQRVEVIIRDINNTRPRADFIDWFKDNGISPGGKVRRQRRNGRPLFSVRAEIPEPCVDRLTTDGMQMGVVHLEVERAKTASFRIPTRCKKCQEFGHESRNCGRPIVCSFCSARHLVSKCKIKQACGTPTCANCRKRRCSDVSHPAYSGACPTFIAIRNAMNKNAPDEVKQKLEVALLKSSMNNPWKKQDQHRNVMPAVDSNEAGHGSLDVTSQAEQAQTARASVPPMRNADLARQRDPTVMARQIAANHAKAQGRLKIHKQIQQNRVNAQGRLDDFRSREQKSQTMPPAVPVQPRNEAQLDSTQILQSIISLKETVQAQQKTVDAQVAQNKMLMTAVCAVLGVVTQFMHNLPIAGNEREFESFALVLRQAQTQLSNACANAHASTAHSRPASSHNMPLFRPEQRGGHVSDPIHSAGAPVEVMETSDIEPVPDDQAQVPYSHSSPLPSPADGGGNVRQSAQSSAAPVSEVQELQDRHNDGATGSHARRPDPQLTPLQCPEQGGGNVRPPARTSAAPVSEVETRHVQAQVNVETHNTSRARHPHPQRTPLHCSEQGGGNVRPSARPPAAPVTEASVVSPQATSSHVQHARPQHMPLHSSEHGGGTVSAPSGPSAASSVVPHRERRNASINGPRASSLRGHSSSQHKPLSNPFQRGGIVSPATRSSAAPVSTGKNEMERQSEDEDSKEHDLGHTTPGGPIRGTVARRRAQHERHIQHASPRSRSTQRSRSKSRRRSRATRDTELPSGLRSQNIDMTTRPQKRTRLERTTTMKDAMQAEPTRPKRTSNLSTSFVDATKHRSQKNDH